MRGEWIDIGGRRLRVVREGVKSGAPTVVLEAGAFGFSADFGAVQQRLAEQGLHSLAYDRAGLGRSDPGPKPRDGLAIVGDLEALLAATGEAGPFVLVGHSMAGLFLRIFAARNPGKVVGVVLLDAATPEGVDVPRVRKFVQGFASASQLAALGALVGILPLLSFGPLGDKIGLPPAASAEKRRAFARVRHNAWAGAEVGQWLVTAAQAEALAPFDPDWPIAVVTAGEGDRHAGFKALQATPALASRYPYVRHVAGAGHNSLLGLTFAREVVEAVDHVLAQIGQAQLARKTAL
jgi:pimeloyl-ACP methyl ester carboxylesterase